MSHPCADFEFEEVYDYYVIEAWRDLGERVPAYTREMVTQLAECLASHPHVNPTSSADDGFVIGQTPGWPANPEYPTDPAIPPQDLYGFCISDPDSTADVRMILTAGTHSTEFTGNWVLHGMLEFLVGDTDEANSLREHVAFYVYPDINPEGRYQAVNRIDLEAAPDPNAGTNMRKRGNPELYAAGEKDHNRVWNTEGKFSTVDILSAAMEADAGHGTDYFWGMHGPQSVANWRSPKGRPAWECAYGRALNAREPDVEIAGIPEGIKSGLSFQPGKLSVWIGTDDGLSVEYPYVYEPGGWSQERLLAAGKNLALALFDAHHGEW